MHGHVCFPHVADRPSRPVEQALPETQASRRQSKAPRIARNGPPRGGRRFWVAGEGPDPSWLLAPRFWPSVKASAKRKGRACGAAFGACRGVRGLAPHGGRDNRGDKSGEKPDRRRQDQEGDGGDCEPDHRLLFLRYGSRSSIEKPLSIRKSATPSGLLQIASVMSSRSKLCVGP